ncbi:MAG: site-specific integrase [Candidatus Bathyarchaeota archaeon]|nr:site-specific integrase [Candidatus Bathyarchaeota archaeon]
MSNKEWLSDPYVTEWLSKVGDRTQQNYKERFPKWLAFIGMTPTEQFQKRIKDLQSTNPKERGFFEDKVVEFKNALIAQNFKASTIQCTLTPVLSFFSAHRVPLRFKRKELKIETRTEDKVIREWIPDNQQAKQIYQHGDARDRALFLCLYQSGFSETDVSSLNVEDLPNIEQCEGHYPISMYREKTDVLQRTCLSEECVHDIKELLKERQHSGTLKPDSNGKTPLFISQKGQRLTTRFINDTIKAMVEKTYGKDRAEEFKTKSLRDAYNDALLRANLTQEIKDTLFGHKRSGAREKYAISQSTIIDAYNKAFQFLTVNHGTQARKDIEVMRDQMREMRDANDETMKNLNKRIAYLEELLTKNNIQFTEVMNSISNINERLTYYETHGKKKPAFDKFR